MPSCRTHVQVGKAIAAPAAGNNSCQFIFSPSHPPRARLPAEDDSRGGRRPPLRGRPQFARRACRTLKILKRCRATALQSKRAFAGRFCFGLRAIYRRFEIFGCPERQLADFPRRLESNISSPFSGWRLRIKTRARQRASRIGNYPTESRIATNRNLVQVATASKCRICVATFSDGVTIQLDVVQSQIRRRRAAGGCGP